MTAEHLDVSHRPRLLVGNDVVDLSHPRCRDTPLDGRLVRRVCAAEERLRIARSDEPRRALWRTWAAKEAAYKVISKRLGSPPPFVHTRFLVREKTAAEVDVAEGPAGAGTVTYEGTKVPFREEAAPASDVLHVVAWSPDRSPVLEARAEPLPSEPPPLHLLTERERSAVHSPASGWVRLAARSRAAALLERPESELQIVCGEGPQGRTAPLLLVGGDAAGPWDVSLSHHGGWVAWALGRAGDADRDAAGR